MPLVVLGRSANPERDLDLDACRADRVPILWRCSGGGAVVLGPGCLTYSLRLSLEHAPALRDVATSYRLILGALARALAVPGLEIRGLADLALDNRKVSGNAQRRDSGGLLHHGTLLYGFDSRLAMRYLRPPHRPPAYRQDRTHLEFLGNLPLSSAEIRARLAGFRLD